MRSTTRGPASKKGTPFHATSHLILLPGDPTAGSAVMVAQAGADKSCFSINHGAGRQMGRKQAIRTLDQQKVDGELDAEDTLLPLRRGITPEVERYHRPKSVPLRASTDPDAKYHGRRFRFGQTRK